MDNSNKVLNPTTGRYVKKSSTLGKLILAGKTPPKKPAKTCSDSQIRNPSTQRCIKKTGKIARSLGNSPMTSNGSFVASSSSSPLALPIIPGAYVPPAVVPQPQLITTSQAASILDKRKSDLIKMNKKIKEKNRIIEEKNLNAIKIQSAIRNKIARKKYPLIFQDAPDFPQPLTTSQADAILDKRKKMSENIQFSKSLFDKDISLPKSDVDMLKAVKYVNTNIRNINKPKIKRTNKRNAMDIDKPVKKEDFYKKANRKIKEAMPALIGAGIATGIGLSGRI